MNVAVIGASDKKERYSYMALMLLKEHGHHVFPVHQRLKSIEGMAVYPSLDAITELLDTMTFYVAADISTTMASQVLAKKPRRLIFNPGAENPQLTQLAEAAGIESLDACTLVMLRTQQF